MELFRSKFIHDANLQGYWRLEADGTDSSRNGYTLTGTAPSYVAGKYNNGADFERSSNQYLRIVNASCPKLLTTGSQSMGCWWKPESIVDWEEIMGLERGNANKDLYIGATLGNKPAFRVMGLTTAGVTSTVALSTGTMYFICGVYDKENGKLKIWVNDTKTEASTSGTATSHTGDTNFSIGGEGSGDIDGIVDDAFFFDRALTDAEVGVIYNAGPGIGGAFLLNLL